MKKWWVIALLPAFCLPATAQESVRRFNGYAYDLKSNVYLYTEVHEHTIANGKWISGVSRYFLPDGRELGSKTLDFTNDPFVPVYRLALSLEGFAEGITGNTGRIEMTRQAGPGKKVETESVSKEGLMAADAGLPKLLLARLDELSRGETLKFRIAVPGHLETFKFRSKRIEDGSFEGKTAVRIQVDMDSMLNMFAGPLTFSFDPAARKLLEYRGTSNIRDPRTGDAYVVRIAYPETPPQDAGKLPPGVGP